ncbi:MAG: OmpP1/FadL family transporter [Bacteroidota bacterium]
MRVRTCRGLKLYCLSLLTLLVGISSQALAQFPEDALRFATPGIGVGARSLGMGNAYTGVANDYTALFWNPAGLAQIEHGEFSFGLSQLNFKDKSQFFDQNQSYTNNATNLNSLGLVFPVPVRQGSLVFAFGYARQSNFTTGLSFEGFNPNTSIIQTWAPDSSFYPPDVTIAEELGLAYADTNTGRFNSKIINRVTQSGKVLEGGGVNNWSAGVAIDAAKNLSVGATLTYATGSYTYERSYTEADTRRLYETTPFDFDRVTVEDMVESDLSGFNAKLGLLYRVPERFRFGLTIKTPTTFEVTENFSTTANSYFDNGDILPTAGPYEVFGEGKYDVATPWVFGAGVSVIIRDLVLSGDVEYTDWTQLKFEDANADLISLNKDIKEIFRPTANLRAGAEYDIRDVGVRVRGGFIYNPSPYEGDPSSFDQKYITGGLGILLSEFTMLDLGYARGWWKTFRSNYDTSSLVSEDISTNNFILTFSYRF